MELQEQQEVGKSSVSEIIKINLNAELLDADKIAKELAYKNSKYLVEIVSSFGDEILNVDKTLNRQALANIIYNDITGKNELDKITFKFVCQKIEDEIKRIKTENICEYILIDAPLLLEANLNEKCDYIISIIANKEVKVSRICARDNITKEIAIKRLNIQKDDEYYISKADFVIENNGDKKSLNKKVNEICKKIQNI